MPMFLMRSSWPPAIELFSKLSSVLGVAGASATGSSASSMTTNDALKSSGWNAETGVKTVAWRPGSAPGSVKAGAERITASKMDDMKMIEI